MLSSLQLTDHSKKLRNLPAARRAGEVFRFGGAARYSSLGGRRGIPVWGGRRGIPVWGAARYSGLGGRRGIPVQGGGGEVFRFGGAARYSGSERGGEVFRFGGAASSSWKSSPPPGCWCPSQNLRGGAARYSGSGGRRALPGRALHPQGVSAHPKTFGAHPKSCLDLRWTNISPLCGLYFLEKRRALPRTALHPLLYCKYWFPLDVPYIGSIPGLGLTLCYWVYNRGRRAVLGRALHFES